MIYDMPTLISRLTPELWATLAEPGSWHMWPAASDRQAWEAVLTPERRAWLVARAEAALTTGFPALPLSLYLDCKRTDNRVRGETAIFGRRTYLGHVVLAWAATRDPRWLEAAADAVWAVCEETTWCVPAHTGHHPDATGRANLPRHRRHVIDLFAAETAAVLSDALDVLGGDLAELDAELVPRIVAELRERVIDPLADDARWGWLGGRNNWTPWIAANLTRTVLTHARDRAQCELVVTRLLTGCDKLLANYPADGGCDEGIRYWGVSFGTMFLVLEALHAASGGRIVLFDDPRFVALGTFPVHAHLVGAAFLPFGDNTGAGGVRGALGWHIGERLQLPALQQVAWLQAHNWQDTAPESGTTEPLHRGGNGSNLQDLLWQLFWMPANAARPVVAPPAERVWLPDLQVLICRSPGLTLAVKGGHNDENHNHNDVGQVHILKDARPLIIDPGVEAYTMKTFSGERYQIWCIRGSGHNPPVINGHEQCAGRQYAARAVQCVGERFSADLAACYPAAAQVSSAERSVEFDRAAQRITVRDVVAAPGPLEVTTNWFLTCDPQLLPVVLDHGEAEVTVSAVALEDAGLRASWGTDTLWRVTATVRGHERVSTSLTIQG